MGLLSWILGSQKELTPLDLSDIQNPYDKVKLKQGVLNAVVGKIQSACQSVTFQSGDENLDYKLNVKPNTNQNAMEFRNEFVYRLLNEGEVLIVKVADAFYIADNYEKETQVIGDTKFSKVSRGELTFNGDFYSRQVFYVTYQNSALKKYINGLDDDYTNLLKRIVEVQLRERQLRIYAKSNIRTKDKEDMNASLKRFFMGWKKEIEENSVAIVPYQNGLEFDEKAQSYLGRSVDEIGELDNVYLKKVADALQVPGALFRSDVADVSEHNKNFIRWCIRPLMNLLATEINAKYFSAQEIKSGKGVKVNTINLY